MIDIDIANIFLALTFLIAVSILMPFKIKIDINDIKASFKSFFYFLLFSVSFIYFFTSAQRTFGTAVELFWGTSSNRYLKIQSSDKQLKAQMINFISSFLSFGFLLFFSNSKISKSNFSENLKKFIFWSVKAFSVIVLVFGAQNFLKVILEALILGPVEGGGSMIGKYETYIKSALKSSFDIVWSISWIVLLEFGVILDGKLDNLSCFLKIFKNKFLKKKNNESGVNN